MIAVIRIRGRVGVREDIEKTLRLLRLRRKHTCVVLRPTKDIAGMINKVKDYVTWGEIDRETLKELLIKRGRLVGNKKLTEEYLKEKLGMSLDDVVDKIMKGEMRLRDIPGLKPFFRLSPPRGGFERGGIKRPFHLGGALGYRGRYINDLIRRMI